MRLQVSLYMAISKSKHVTPDITHIDTPQYLMQKAFMVKTSKILVIIKQKLSTCTVLSVTAGKQQNDRLDGEWAAQMVPTQLITNYCVH